MPKAPPCPLLWFLRFETGLENAENDLNRNEWGCGFAEGVGNTSGIGHGLGQGAGKGRYDGSWTDPGFANHPERRGP